MELVDRFLKYVGFDTQSSEEGETCPSTEEQMAFARYLEQELKDVGLADVSLDEHGYLFATLPANTDREVPTIGFIAHIDTSPDCSGKDVKPRIVEKYDGGDIVLSAEDGIVTSPKQFPELPEAGVKYRAVFHSARHFRQRIVSHAHGVPLVGYPAGFLVQKVTTLVGDMFMKAAVLLLHLLIAAGTRLHPGKPGLQRGQLALRLGQPVGRVGRRAVVRHIEMRQRELEPHGGFPGGGHRLRRADRAGIQQTGKIIAGFAALHGDTAEFPSAARTAGKPGLDQAVFCDPHRVPRGVECDAVTGYLVADGKAVPIRLFPFVLGVTKRCRIAKKIAERLRQLVILLCQRLMGYFSQKWRLRLVFGGRRDKVRVGFKIEALLIGQHPIPHIAAAPEGLLKQLVLLGRGVNPNLNGGILQGWIVFASCHGSFLCPHTPPQRLSAFADRRYLFEKLYLCK